MVHSGNRLFVVGLVFSSVAQALVPLPFLSTSTRIARQRSKENENEHLPVFQSIPVALFQSKSINNEDAKEGYKFGDITRNLARQAKEKVNELTGKDEYEFGDLARFLDGRAKERVQAIKGKQSDYRYEIGDFTRWADSLAKEKAANFAGKDNAKDYELGDISRTLIRKVMTGEYSMDDVFLALRILAMAGYTLVPITRLLPIEALIPLINASLVKDVGGRMTEVLATSLDARMREALTGNANYQLGDITKDRLKQELARFTGKPSYSAGDLTRHLIERGTAKMVQRATGSSMEEKPITGSSQRFLSLPDSLAKDLERWDLSFLDKQGAATKDDASWEKYVKETYKDKR